MYNTYTDDLHSYTNMGYCSTEDLDHMYEDISAERVKSGRDCNDITTTYTRIQTWGIVLQRT